MAQENIDTSPKTKKKRPYRGLRIFGRVMLGILVFLMLVVLFIRSEWGQGIIVNKAVKYVSDKTNTKVAIDKLYITFDGDILLKGLYLEDKKGDTLIYSKYLEADIPLWPMIKGNGIGIEQLDSEGLRANITRKDTINSYNFQFLIDAFAPENPTTTTVTDTTATSKNIIIGTINLKDVNVVYKDDVSGIDSHFIVGNLHLEMEETDLENFIFKASKGYIENTTVTYYQSPVYENPNAESTPLPSFTAEELTLKNVYIDYASYGDRIAATLDITDMYAEVPLANFATYEIDITEFTLKDSKVNIRTETENNVITETVEEVAKEIKQDIKNFEWPEIKFAIDKLDLENNDFSYFVAGAEAKKGVFNPDAIVLNNLRVKGSNIFIKDKKAGLTISETSFQEFSDFNIKEFSVSAEITDERLQIENIKLALNDNHINGRVTMDYPSLSQLISAPEESRIDLNIPNFKANLKEVFKFQPELASNEYLQTLSKKYLSGNITASGYLSQINISNTTINWGRDTKISGTGSISNATNPDNLKFNFPKFKATTQKTDLLRFVNEEELGVSLPENVAISGSFKGSTKDVYTDATLTTSQGIAIVKGNFTNDTKLAFDATIQIKDYQINKLFKNEQLGNLNVTLTGNGNGNTINDLDAVVNAKVTDLEFNDYAIQDLSIDGTFKNGKGTVISDYKDTNLNAELYADVVLDSVNPRASLKLNVIGADLQALGLMQRNVRTGLVLTADFVGNSKRYNVSGLIDNGVIVYDNKTYLIGDINARARIREDSTSIAIDNKILDLKLESNTDPQTFATAVKNHVFSYFYRDAVLPDTLVNPVIIKMRGTLSDTPLIRDVFLVNLQELDTIKMAVDFDETKRKLKADVRAPHINYSGSQIDSLVFTMDTDKENFMFDFGFKNVKAGPFDIQRTKISGNQINNELDLDFIAFQKDSTLIQIKTQITGDRDRLRLHVKPDALIIQENKWETPANNEVIFTKNGETYDLDFNDFNFSRNTQSVSFRDDLPSVDKKHIAVNFQNFELNEFLNYLNPEEKFAKGNLSGDFILEDPFGATGIIANLTIKQFNLLDVELGTMTLDAKSLGGNQYDFNAAIKGGDVDLDFTGDYRTTENKAFLNLDLALNQVNMKALEGFSLGEVTDTDGSFHGNFKVEGTLLEPKYEGSLTFTDADLTIKKLNTPFTFANETLNINNEGLKMDSFTILDANGNTFVASGEIGTETYLNPTFDLRVKADNFQLLNAKEDDNAYIYGQATVNATATIKGDLQIPIVDIDASINENTDVVYKLPSSSVNIESRDGIVIFVNRENPDAILTRTEEQTATVTGFDINARFSLGNKAKVKVIIDENTGDNFQVYGDGDFEFAMKPNGRMTLSGLYTASGGYYEMNLYSLVNRRFELVKGSKISWVGDPFDAKLDIKALYNVEASAAPLMASVTSGSDPAVQSRFRQVLPFQVYLNIEGELTAPIINFNMDMPEDEQGAIGGQVYGRLQQLNSQEAELNKQVFSLLVLNRFYPEPGSDGSRGGVASIARDNLNDALSDQLNVFSDKLLGDTGLELDFGLDSYTDYQGTSPTERTQLDIAAQKKLFDDRLIVRVGSAVDLQGSSASGESTPLVGNVSLEYLLTNNGRYRLKGFRRNEFENVIDGQTIVSGIALIFTQEFNRFDELWDALFRSQSEKEADKKIKEKEQELKEKEKQQQSELKRGDLLKENPKPETIEEEEDNDN